MVMDYQLTLMFRVDDVLIIQLHPQIITKCFKLLDSEHGKDGPLTFTRVNVHEYLVMMLDFRIKVSCVFS